jgi:hypothetical protein
MRPFEQIERVAPNFNAAAPHAIAHHLHTRFIIANTTRRSSLIILTTLGGASYRHDLPERMSLELSHRRNPASPLHYL